MFVQFLIAFGVIATGAAHNEGGIACLEAQDYNPVACVREADIQPVDYSKLNG